jgi:regulatory protein
MRNSRTERPARRAGGPARIATTIVDLSTLNDPLIVSALAETPNRSGRVRVSINGEEVGDVTLDFVADAGLRSGGIVTRTQADDVLAAARRTAVLDKALDLLAVRARSSRDLSIRLRRACAADPDISWAVARLMAQGLLDDAAYARGVARSKVLAGGVSRRRVMSVLRQKGVAPEVASDAISETLSEVDLDEFGAALIAARKRVRALSSVDPARRRQRLYAFLARRGYEHDVVRRVVTEVLSSGGGEAMD